VNESLDLTIIIVSYNTRQLTLKCLETLFEKTVSTKFRTVVFDNDSRDGTVDAILRDFPQVEVVASQENFGFARANNLVAASASTDWILLLNPDTEVYEGAIDNLLEFSRNRPKAGITGGRTFFPDGSLNPLSCQGRITVWSSFCKAAGLSMIFPNSALFNSEAYGGWKRDTAREVDIIVGCFLMVQRSLWVELDGFELRYFMYGEDSDLSLRASKLGFRPAICPEAEIMHLVGASSRVKWRKQVMVAKSRTTLIHDHWNTSLIPIGVSLIWAWAATRTFWAYLTSFLKGRTGNDRLQYWTNIWQCRDDWLQPYKDGKNDDSSF
jgi:N-acetylglucosaminyl-diphospho-decaprenol L-rhamnosyltransferase